MLTLFFVITEMPASLQLSQQSHHQVWSSVHHPPSLPPPLSSVGIAPGIVTLMHTHFSINILKNRPLYFYLFCCFLSQISSLSLTLNAQWDTLPRSYLHCYNSSHLFCELNACYYVPTRGWCILVWLLLNSCFTATGRRSAPPLNLTGLPGTEKLNEREKEVQLPFLYQQQV